MTYILISSTYSIVTPKSAEDGENADAGFRFEDEFMTFRELVAYIRNNGYLYPSCHPATGDTCEWLNTEPETDFRTGEEETRGLHYAHRNPPRLAKYWRKAMRAAGVR